MNQYKVTLILLLTNISTHFVAAHPEDLRITPPSRTSPTLTRTPEPFVIVTMSKLIDKKKESSGLLAFFKACCLPCCLYRKNKRSA